MEIYGNTQGLNHLIKRRIKNLYRKKQPVNAIITVDMARNLFNLSKEIGRQIGILINRRGNVESVIVGEKEKIRIPELPKERAGRSRFKGLRFIHTHLNGEILTKEDLTDLALLQLDLSASLFEDKTLREEAIHIGYLIPENPKGKIWDFLGPLPVRELNVNFIEFITELENEFEKARGANFPIKKDRDSCLIVSVPPKGHLFELSEHLEELKSLCESAGLFVADIVIQRPKELHPKFLIGKGKMEEVIMKSQQLGIDLLLFDRELTPTQIKNISAMTELKVIDRNQLILDIFAERAKTSEAKIQVELAQLKYILPRLSEKDTAFSRLTGGIGGRGPGETKLEIDKRRIKDRISFLEKKLKEIRDVRDKKREKRRSSNIPIVSIVGYTNSGKSTLLNLLTKSEVEVGERPFSTLNPTSRLIKYPERRPIILTDTVGFIRNLPNVLLNAFMATLEELEDASLLLHLVDISDPHFEEKIEEVERILGLLNFEKKKRLIVFNKIDKVERSALPSLEERYNGVSISCLKKLGINRLLERIEEELKDRPLWN